MVSLVTVSSRSLRRQLSCRLNRLSFLTVGEEAWCLRVAQFDLKLGHGSPFRHLPCGSAPPSFHSHVSFDAPPTSYLIEDKIIELLNCNVRDKFLFSPRHLPGRDTLVNWRARLQQPFTRREHFQAEQQPPWHFFLLPLPSLDFLALEASFSSRRTLCFLALRG
jgi:hypothetical protein